MRLYEREWRRQKGQEAEKQERLGREGTEGEKGEVTRENDPSLLLYQCDGFNTSIYLPTSSQPGPPHSLGKNKRYRCKVYIPRGEGVKGRRAEKGL